MNIEQAVSSAVANLQLGTTFTLNDLIEAIQVRRQRRLLIRELRELNTSDGICAIWLTRDNDDIVLHAHTDSALHRQQFVLHEFAHMILGHCDGDDCDSADALLPNIPPYTRSRLLARQDPDCDAEIAAEALADRLAAGIRGRAFAESRYLEVFG